MQKIYSMHTSIDKVCNYILYYNNNSDSGSVLYNFWDVTKLYCPSYFFMLRITL